MNLSVVIVNYNVERFLEQCLHSVFKASEGLDVEVFVVDNASVDGSVDMVRNRFPQVQLIESQENLGFSKGNNLAIKKSTGKYILLLNPDTVVEEDSFHKCFDHMEAHPECGGLGVQMVDGKGRFLPESKRGLPTPMTSFFKISGIYRFFPKSPTINRYYMGQLPKDQNGEVEILAGAFMWMRKETLDKVGLLDETFFMYGEDIDLSYRIIKGGYTNRYLADTRIIHYKGESTKKGSLNYVYVFYQAMAIFAKKHFNSGGTSIFLAFIQLAIGLRASLSVVKRIFDKTHLLTLDSAALFSGMYLLKTYWEDNHRFVSGGGYPEEFMSMAVPIYMIFWILSAALSGAYDRPIRLISMQRGVALGSLILLASYGLLNEDWRFSRALLLLGSAWALLSMSLIRFGLHQLKGNYLKSGNKIKRCWLVGSSNGVDQLQSRLQQLRPDVHIAGNSIIEEGAQANFTEYVRIFKLDEIIFDAQSMSTNDILNQMTQLSGTGVEIKIAPPESMFIIGSNSIHQQGDWYSMGGNALDVPLNQRNKRITDVFLSLLFLVTSPLLLFSTNGRKYLSNLLFVVVGKKTWVGFHSMKTPSGGKKRESVIHPADAFQTRISEESMLERLDLLYARDYRWISDIEILWQALFRSSR